MTNDTIERLNAEFAESAILYAESTPSATEVAEASREIGVPFSADYCEFLTAYGAAMVGPYPIFGLRPVAVMGNRRWSVVDVTREYRRNRLPSSDDWAIISEDHAGNPVGMDREGVIWIHDHDFGGIARIANDFEEYIRVHCLKLPAV
jgi:hypothetical protein